MAGVPVQEIKTMTEKNKGILTRAAVIARAKEIVREVTTQRDDAISEARGMLLVCGLLIDRLGGSVSISPVEMEAAVMDLVLDFKKDEQGNTIITRKVPAGQPTSIDDILAVAAPAPQKQLPATTGEIRRGNLALVQDNAANDLKYVVDVGACPECRGAGVVADAPPAVCIACGGIGMAVVD
jgi:hypothetical protein